MPRILLAGLLCVLLVHGTRAAAPPGHPLPFEIARWVEQLSDEEDSKRRAAAVKLRAAGEYAEAALEKAVVSEDAEVRRRARPILADLRRGIFPDTPIAVVELIGQYEAVAPSEKTPIIRKLLAAGRHGCRALVRLARFEKDAITRKEVFLGVFAELVRAVPTMIERDNDQSLEAILELALQADAKIGGMHFAAHHLLAGSLDRQIARLQREAKAKVVAKTDHEILAYLYRAKGDFDSMLRSAKEAERIDLIETALVEKADWKTLNDKPDLVEGGDPFRKLAVLATFARLAGDQKNYNVIVKDLIDKGGAGLAEGGFSLGLGRRFAKALLMNHQPDEALALLEKEDAKQQKAEATRLTNHRLRYELTVARLQYKKAAELVEQFRKEKIASMPEVELAHARTLHMLGEKSKASDIVKLYTDRADKEPEADWLLELVEAYLVLERKDEAFALAAKRIKSANDGAVSAAIFSKLFSDESTDAAALWALLRRPVLRLEHAAAMTKLRELMAGKGNKADIENLIRAANDLPPNSSESEMSMHRIAAGDAARRCKQDGLAAGVYRDANSVRGLIRLGDLHANSKQWAKAATLYLDAFRRGVKQIEKDEAVDAQPALALFLHGHALVEAGKQTEGHRRIDQAHRIPLGDGDVRSAFARELMRRGHRDAAVREQGYLRRLGEPTLTDRDSYNTAEGHRAAALRALNTKRYQKAADSYEQAFLAVLNLDLQFMHNSAFVMVPALTARMRALASAEAGRFDDAVAEVKRNQAVMPGDVDLAQRLVPLLESKGRKKDADALYVTTKGVWVGLIKEYPNAPLMRNQLAWLCAACRRDVGEALPHARKAVELAPDSAAFRDTLAEVLFQLGKKDEAITQQKKAIELSPKREYFKRQLKRIESGDPKVPLPTEDDEDEE